MLARPCRGSGAVSGAVAFSREGRFALSGSWDKTLKLWDVAEWTQRQAPPL
jgi:WD40 repeat protein